MRFAKWLFPLVFLFACELPVDEVDNAAKATTANEKLALDIDAEENLAGVMIQPAKKNADGTIVVDHDKRAWRFPQKDADGKRAGIWDTILKTSGITPCTSRPGGLTGAPGYLDVIPEGSSLVLDEKGSRATFAYWVTNGKGTTHFILFSYDHVDVPAKDGQPMKCICAAEVFVFGPMTIFHGIPTPNAAPLQDGLAVAGDGRLLPEVPLEIARVFNYDAVGKYRDGKKHDKTEPVRPGVKKDGEGCLLCHGTNVDAEPQVTRAFPWFTVPDPSADAGAPETGASDSGARDH